MTCFYCKDKCTCEKDYWKDQWQTFINGIAWNDLIFITTTFLISSLIFGWWGILIGLFLINSMRAGGGNWISMEEYHAPESRTKCSEEILNCLLCNNEYSHEFNVEYYQSLKWWQKVL